MKSILVASVFLTFLVSCAKDESPTAPGNDIIMGDTAKLTAVGSANFIDGPHGRVSGTAILIDSAGYLRLQLKDLQSSNGPDLHVYLSMEEQPLHFIQLGNLKSVSGNQVYIVPGMPNWKDYPYVLIHCEAYNHLFGSAFLQ